MRSCLCTRLCALPALHRSQLTVKCGWPAASARPRTKHAMDVDQEVAVHVAPPDPSQPLILASLHRDCVRALLITCPCSCEEPNTARLSCSGAAGSCVAFGSQAGLLTPWAQAMTEVAVTLGAVLLSALKQHTASALSRSGPPQLFWSYSGPFWDEPWQLLSWGSWCLACHLHCWSPWLGERHLGGCAACAPRPTSLCSARFCHSTPLRAGSC